MFLFASCQIGAEKILKTELTRLFPSFRASFSRPGFLTVKVPDTTIDPLNLAWQWLEESVFTRSTALSLGMFEVPARTSAENVAAASLSDEVMDNSVCQNVWKLVSERHFFVNRIHVFRRDPFLPGEKNFEPGTTSQLLALHKSLHDTIPNRKFLGLNADKADHPAMLDETVLDVVEIDPGHFAVGVHRIHEDSSIQAYFPGGVMPLTLPDDAASRAWLKFEEALRWSGFTIDAHSQCLDIGAAPGGGTQTLLARGAAVLGVDPGEMADAVAHHPHFTHIRGKMNQTRRDQYKKVRWVIADMNVAPAYTLEVLEDLLARQGKKIRGMIFTLKMFHPEMAQKLPEHAQRIEKWGFDEVRIKQLAFNRREVMVCVQKTDRGAF